MAPWPALQAIHCSAGTAVASCAALVRGPSKVVGTFDRQQLGAFDRQHVPHAASFQPASQGWAAAIDLIGGHPRRRHPGVQRTLQHDLGKLRLGPKPDLLGDLGSPAAGRVVGPALGQVQLPVDHRPPLGAGVGQEHAQLAVVDLAGGARVLALDPHRGRALLEKPRLVDHQHPAGVAEVLDDVAAQVVADQVRVPVGGGEQPPHAVWGALAGVLGQLPADLLNGPRSPGSAAVGSRVPTGRSSSASAAQTGLASERLRGPVGTRQGVAQQRSVLPKVGLPSWESPTRHGQKVAHARPDRG